MITQRVLRASVRKRRSGRLKGLEPRKIVLAGRRRRKKAKEKAVVRAEDPCLQFAPSGFVKNKQTGKFGRRVKEPTINYGTPRDHSPWKRYKGVNRSHDEMYTPPLLKRAIPTREVNNRKEGDPTHETVPGKRTYPKIRRSLYFQVADKVYFRPQKLEGVKEVERASVEDNWWKGRVVEVRRKEEMMKVYCLEDQTYGWVHMKEDVQAIKLVGERCLGECYPYFEVSKELVKDKKP